MLVFETIQRRAEQSCITWSGNTIAQIPRHNTTMCVITIQSYSIHIATVQDRADRVVCICQQHKLSESEEEQKLQISWQCHTICMVVDSKKQSDLPRIKT